MFKNKNRKKIKITKRKVLKVANGAISILLSLLLTPFLSTALGLVELARYQEVMQLTQEIMELVGVSELTDYDQYIHDRFGILCTSQEDKLGENVETNLSGNSKVLAKQISISNVTTWGDMSLMNEEVLYHQVVTIGELTSPTAIIAKDFKLKELLDKLNGISEFNNVMTTMTKLSEATNQITAAVDALKSLKTTAEELQNLITETAKNAQSLTTKMQDLYKKIGDEGLVLPQEATLEEIQAVVDTFSSTYLDDLKDVYETAFLVKENFESVKSKADTLKQNARDFEKAVKTVKDTIASIGTDPELDEDGKKNSAVTETLDSVLDAMDEVVKITVENITDETVNTIKSTLNTIVNNAMTSAGLDAITQRYQDIMEGTYFDLPLSESTQQDVLDLIGVVQDVYEADNPNAIIDFLKDKFVPDLSAINVDTIISKAQNAIEEATENLVGSSEDSLITMLTKLVNLVKKMFSMEVLYDTDLNSYLNYVGDGNGEEESAYQKFLDAITAVFDSVETFTEAFDPNSGDGFFERIKKALTAAGTLLTSVGEMFVAIGNAAADTINNVKSLVCQLGKGNFREIYERLIVIGYLRHNLPCRTSDADEYDEDTNYLILEGEGLTGFSYNDIARPVGIGGQGLGPEIAKGFMNIGTLIKGLKNGGGTDKMFKGAELEYVRAGTDSEIMNQLFTFVDLYFLRLLLDLPSVLTDPEVASIATAATVASWVVFLLYILIEPLCDTILLVNGASISLVRSGCWATPSGIVDFIDELSDLASDVLSEDIKSSLNGFASDYKSTSEEKGESPRKDKDGNAKGDGQDYQTHMLLIMLIHLDTKTMISRLQDIIELETAEYYRQNGKTFSMSKTYTAIEMQADVTFNSFFDLGSFSGGSPFLPTYKVKQAVSY